MGIVLYKEPKLEKPDMVASWPGIGNIGLITAESLRTELQAEELGEIEPWEYFYPTKAILKNGIIQDLQFPRNKFYYKNLGGKDLIIFIGEEQPSDIGGMYAEGEQAYRMGSLVLSVAERFGCRRIYTSGAAVSFSHHSIKPRVWSVTGSKQLNAEIKRCENTVLMGEIADAGEHGSITGLNGLLLGLAKKKGFEAVCLMGEIPDYLSRAPFPFPRASKSVLEVLTTLLGTKFDYAAIDEMIRRVDDIIEGIWREMPAEVQEKIEQRKSILQTKPETITEEDEKWMKSHIDELFKKKGGGNERPA